VGNRQETVTIIGDTKSFEKAMGNASKATGKFGSVLSGIGVGIGLGIFNVAEKAIGGFVDFLGDSVKAANAAENSQVLLNQSLKNNVPAWNGSTAAMDAAVKSGEKLGFAATDTRNSLSSLLAVTKNQAEATKDEALAENIAAARHISLADATKIVIAVEEGNYKSARKLGIEIPKNATKAQALAIINKALAGSAQDVANTQDGQLAASNAQLQGDEEQLGSVINQLVSVVLPVLLTDVNNVADAITSWVSNNQPLINQIKTDLVGALKIASDFISNTLIPTFLKIVDFVQNKLIPAVKPLVQQFVKDLQGAFKTASDFVTNTLIPVFQKIADFIQNTLIPAVTPVITSLQNDIPTAIDTAEGAFNNLKNAISPVTDAFGEMMADKDSIIGAFTIIGALVLYNVVPPFVAWATATIAATWPIIAIGVAAAALFVILEKTGMLKLLGQIFENIAKNILPIFSTAIGFITNTVIPGAVGAFKAIVGAIQNLPNIILGIPGDIVSIITGIPGVFVQALQSIPGLILAGIQIWTNLFIGIPAGLITLVSTLPGKFVDIIAPILPKFVALVGDAGRGIVGLLLSLPGKIVDLVTTLPGKFVDIATAILTGMTGLVTNIVTTLMGIPGQLVALGGDIVNTIINGLSGLPGDIANAVRSAFASINIQVGPFHITGSGITVDMPNIGFATGAWNLPQDMTARVHKGEMIIPATVAQQFRSFLTGTRALNGTASGLVGVGASGGSTGASRGSTGGDTFVFEIGTLYGSQRDVDKLMDQVATRLRVRGART